MKDTFQSPESSFIQGAIYDDETLRMLIYIGDDTFECQGVPVQVWQEFKQSPSKGQYFNRNIKGLYQHEYFE